MQIKFKKGKLKILFLALYIPNIKKVQVPLLYVGRKNTNRS